MRAILVLVFVFGCEKATESKPTSEKTPEPTPVVTQPPREARTVNPPPPPEPPKDLQPVVKVHPKKIKVRDVVQPVKIEKQIKEEPSPPLGEEGGELGGVEGGVVGGDIGVVGAPPPPPQKP
jgi:hypothetical protein